MDKSDEYHAGYLFGQNLAKGQIEEILLGLSDSDTETQEAILNFVNRNFTLKDVPKGINTNEMVFIWD